MTNWGFICGCSILALAIFYGAFYINRAIQQAYFVLAAAVKDNKLGTEKLDGVWEQEKAAKVWDPVKKVSIRKRRG